MIKLPKRTINVTIILATLAFAVYYFNKHSYLVKDLTKINPLVGLLVLALYLVMLFALTLVFSATINMVDFKLKPSENIILNAYSMFINFFVPGQAGTAYRAYYLNKNHKLKVIDYSLATITYYIIYAILSVVLLVAGSQKWWVGLMLILVIGLLLLGGSKIYITKFKHWRINLDFKNLGWLIGATLFQAVVQIIIYFVELHSVNRHIRFDQVITYTGAADLALFVSLTPAAIGIRESFLVLSQKLHHVSTANIILANVIDRSVFIIFLLLLGLGILIIKSKNIFQSFNFKTK